jgi:biopolymer transport protein ExbD
MAFGRLERMPASQPMSDINMTPLIDVMLVLLVIFMIAAPLMATSLKLELPKTVGSRPGDTSDVLTFTITADGRTEVDGRALDARGLSALLAATARRQPPPEVLVRADRRVAYGRVAELIGQVQDAGLTHIGFITEPSR